MSLQYTFASNYNSDGSLRPLSIRSSLIASRLSEISVTHELMDTTIQSKPSERI